jgi:hypothetical protein
MDLIRRSNRGSTLRFDVFFFAMAGARPFRKGAIFLGLDG